MRAAIGILPWTVRAQTAADAAGPMKITKVEAVRFRESLRIQGISPNWMWVRLHTDKVIIGVGESYPGYDAHRGALKELAPSILGKDPTQIERLWQDIFYHISYQPWGGADFRMLTAINIAQWDILGKAAGLPVYKLLGGKAQQRLMVYNTMNGWPISQLWQSCRRRRSILGACQWPCRRRAPWSRPSRSGSD